MSAIEHIKTIPLFPNLPVQDYGIKQAATKARLCIIGVYLGTVKMQTFVNKVSCRVKLGNMAMHYCTCALAF
jgi:hypothetical protein